jgi:hypothetical protein
MVIHRINTIFKFFLLTISVYLTPIFDNELNLSVNLKFDKKKSLFDFDFANIQKIEKVKVFDGG